MPHGNALEAIVQNLETETQGMEYIYDIIILN